MPGWGGRVGVLRAIEPGAGCTDDLTAEEGSKVVSELKAVIQAGGRGTRLAPYSTVLPKALMPVGEGTVIDHLLNRFRDAGVE